MLLIDKVIPSYWILKGKNYRDNVRDAEKLYSKDWKINRAEADKSQNRMSETTSYECSSRMRKILSQNLQQYILTRKIEQ